MHHKSRFYDEQSSSLESCNHIILSVSDSLKISEFIHSYFAITDIKIFSEH